MTAYIDFDGVLVNSEPAHLLSYQLVLNESGIELKAEDFSRRYMGKSEADIVSQMGDDFGISIDYVKFAERRNAVIKSFLASEYFKPNTKVIEFIQTTLSLIDKVVLSSQSGRLIRSCLATTGFPTFNEILSAPDLDKTKLEIAQSRVRDQDWVIDDDAAFLGAVHNFTERLLYVRHDLNGPAPRGLQTLDSRRCHG